MNKDLVIIGKVLKAHGIAGEIKVFPLCDDIFYYHYHDVYLLKSESPAVLFSQQDYIISRIKGTKDRPILYLKGFDTIDAAKHIAGTFLAVERSKIPPLDEDEYYYSDLIGAEVILDNGEYYGKIVNVFETIKQEVLEIMHNGEECFVPFVKEWVLSVDIPGKKVIVSKEYFNDEKD